MNNIDVKAEFVRDMNKYFDILNRLPLYPKHKLLIIYNITSTWVMRNLDSIVKEYTKRWFPLPQSGNSRHPYFPVKKLGINT